MASHSQVLICIHPASLQQTAHMFMAGHGQTGSNQHRSVCSAAQSRCRPEVSPKQKLYIYFVCTLKLWPWKSPKGFVKAALRKRHRHWKCASQSCRWYYNSLINAHSKLSKTIWWFLDDFLSVPFSGSCAFLFLHPSPQTALPLLHQLRLQTPDCPSKLLVSNPGHFRLKTSASPVSKTDCTSWLPLLTVG